MRMDSNKDLAWIELEAEVFFVDPDGSDTSTGFYTIAEILIPGGDRPDNNTIFGDTMLNLRQEDGTTHKAFVRDVRQAPDFETVMDALGLDPSFQYRQEQIDEYRKTYILGEESEEKLMASIAHTLNEFIELVEGIDYNAVAKVFMEKQGACDPSLTVDRAQSILETLQKRGYIFNNNSPRAPARP